MAAEAPKIIRKVSLIIIKDRKLLFAKSSKHPDRFMSPGGKLEPGETEKQALIREIKEECNARIKPETIKYAHEIEDWAYGRENTRVNIKLYTGELLDEPKASGEITEIRYFNNEDGQKHTSHGGERIFQWAKDQNLID